MPVFPVVARVYHGLAFTPGPIKIDSVEARLIPRAHRSPNEYVNPLRWTHWIFFPAGTDIKDVALPPHDLVPREFSDWIEVPRGSGQLYRVVFASEAFSGESLGWTFVLALRDKTLLP